MRWLPRLALPLACLAAAVLAQHPDSGPYEALYFYLGYWHEYILRAGDSSIGGSACRGARFCEFDRFLDVTTKSKGGYGGGESDTVSGLAPVVEMAKKLRDSGMKETIEWDPETLVFGAPDGKKVHTDYVEYVSNAMIEDSRAENLRRLHAHQRERVETLSDRVFEALEHMSEVHAVERSKVVELFIKANNEVPGGTQFSFVNASDFMLGLADGQRFVFDTVNLARTWLIEQPWDSLKNVKYSDKVAVDNWGHYPHLGMRWTMLRNKMFPCGVKARLFPRSALPGRPVS